MLGPDVAVEVASLRGSVRTQGTGKRLLSRVRAQVLQHVRFSRKGHPAHRAQYLPLQRRVLGEVRLEVVVTT